MDGNERMKCVKCKHFKIMYEPIRTSGAIWDSGEAKCEKYDLVVEFTSMRKINSLECIESGDSNDGK